MEIHSIVVNPARPGPFPKGDQESFQRCNLTKHMQMRKTEANQENIYIYIFDNRYAA